ncbi:MAG TPA: sterol carrier family protein [Sporichthyaceae bacterium]|nr:sterol carrier family protein [Sporichthyaceae bacterium]
MAPRRRTDPVLGAAAVAAWTADPDGVDAATVATAVRFTLEELTARHPGRAVEVRVPPYGATQCLDGPAHTRGTPPNVVEAEAPTWLGLVTGTARWAEEAASGRVRCSGGRSDLSAVLPLVGS